MHIAEFIADKNSTTFIEMIFISIVLLCLKTNDNKNMKYNNSMIYHRSRSDLNNTTIQWFEDIITEKSIELEIKDLSNNLFLETIIPRNYNYSFKGSGTFQNPIFGVYKNVYFQKCRHLIGQRFRRKKYLQPTTIACLDVENTRSGRNPNSFIMPHIHAITLISDDHLNEMNYLMKHPHLLENVDSRISTISIEPISDLSDGLKSPISYCSKFAIPKSIDDRFSTTYEIYPI